MSCGDATNRFSDRVADYARYRPSYPPEVVALLAEHGVDPPAPVVDLGSGTGIFARLLLDAGYRVFGVEPNEPMRTAAEASLAANRAFTSVAAPAEATTLADHSVAAITVAQAFHWFDHARCRAEFERILQPGGPVLLIWNERLVEGPFLEGYEQVLHDFATDYREVDHRQTQDAAALSRFFAPGRCTRHAFPNEQVFDFDGLRGRLLSSSYAPAADHPNHRPMLDALRRLFDAHQHDGRVAFRYRTEVYVGRFTP